MKNERSPEAWGHLLNDAVDAAADASHLAPSIKTLWKQAGVLLTEDEEASQHRLTWDSFSKAERTHQNILDRVDPLLTRVNALIERRRADAPLATSEEIMARLHEMSAANKKSLKDETRYKDAVRTMEDCAGAWAFHLLLAALPTHTLVLAVHNTLCTFVGRALESVKLVRETKPAAWTALLDCSGGLTRDAGSTLEVLKASPGRIAKEIRHVETTSLLIDRTVQLEETYRELAGFTAVAEECTMLAEDGLNDFSRVFVLDADWLHTSLSRAA